MANGTIHKLGTLYVDNTRRLLPTIPWGSTSSPTGSPSAGNILPYPSTGGDIEIRETDTDDAYKIRWVEVNDNGKKLLISDRCLIHSISWSALNTKGLISGKEITLNGQKYKLRVLTGGNYFRSGSNRYGGGIPITNEWDRIICNEGGFDGLPTPVATDLDSTQNSTDTNSIHNKFWNWYGVYSHTQEMLNNNTTNATLRGHMSARYWDYFTTTEIYAYMGWRPVLEIVNNAPTISDSDGYLGDFTTHFKKQYTISDIDSTSFTVIEKINGVTLRTLTNQTNNTTLTLDLTSAYNYLYVNGINKIEVIVNDDFGNSTIRTWTFTNVVNPLISTSTLKDVIDRTKLLYNGFDLQKNLFKNKLVKGGIEINENARMSDLLNSMDNIKIAFPGEETVLASCNNFRCYSSNSTYLKAMSATMPYNGSVKVKINVNGYNLSGDRSTYVKFSVTRNTKIISIFYSSVTGAGYIDIIKDFVGLQKGDVVEVEAYSYYYNGYSGSYGTISSGIIGCILLNVF